MVLGSLGVRLDKWALTLEGQFGYKMTCLRGMAGLDWEYGPKERIFADVMNLSGDDSG